MIRNDGIRNSPAKLESVAPPAAVTPWKCGGTADKNRHRGIANTNPIPPKIQNDARQCTRSAMNPLNDPPIATPAIWLLAKIATARDRVEGPCALAISA